MIIGRARQAQSVGEHPTAKTGARGVQRRTEKRAVGDAQPAKCMALTILCSIQYSDTVRCTVLVDKQHMSEADEQISNLRLELRRGVVVLAVLSQMDTARYGYDLIRRLAEQGLEIEEGTLYPLLRRLEKQGLLESEWEVEESRPRKYYRISAAGRDVLRTLSADWHEMVEVMKKLLQGEHSG